MDTNQRKELFETVSKFKKLHSWMPPVAGLSQGEFIMMHKLDDCNKEKTDQDTPGVKISTLCACTHMSMPGVSQMLNSLENKEMIERIMAKDDRRVVYVDLTVKGHALLDEAIRKFIIIVDQIMEEFGEEDTKTLIALLNKFYTITEQLKNNK